MKASFEATNANEMEFSMTIIMKLADWKRLKKQLTGNYPSWDLGREITDMICQAQRNFHPETKDKS